MRKAERREFAAVVFRARQALIDWNGASQALPRKFCVGEYSQVDEAVQPGLNGLEMQAPPRNPHSNQAAAAKDHLPVTLQLPARSRIVPVLNIELSEQEEAERVFLINSGLESWHIVRENVVHHISELKQIHLEEVNNLRRQLRKRDLQIAALRQLLELKHLRLDLCGSKIISTLAKGVEAAFDQWNLNRPRSLLNFQLHRNRTSVLYWV